MFLIEAVELIDKLLSSSNSKGGYDHISTPSYGLNNDIHKPFNTVGVSFMDSVTIGGFHDDIVGFFNYCGISQNGTVFRSQVSRIDQLGYSIILCNKDFDNSGPNICPASLNTTLIPSLSSMISIVEDRVIRPGQPQRPP